MAQFSSRLYPQTNPTNPILLALRSVWVAGGSKPVINAAARELARGDWNDITTIRQRYHAARVLKRLASLTG